MTNRVDITIVIIRAAGYAGATWVNTVLGSHPQCLAMGPPERIMTLPRHLADEACFIHRKKCPLWPKFIRSGPHDGVFFERLSQWSGKHTFILNYPPKHLLEKEVFGKGFKIRHIKLVRDGRANVFSYLRHHNRQGRAALIRALREWLIPKWDLIDRKVPKHPTEAALLRYEDMVQRPQESLMQLGNFIGIKYPEDSHLFWRYEHHLGAGNTGVIDTLCQLYNLPGYDYIRKDAYNQMVKELRAEPALPVIDRTWETGFSRAERLIFDTIAGERNKGYGFPRDEFSQEERANCLVEMQ